MSFAPDHSYLGSGIILIRPWGSIEPFAEIGNCSAFSVSPQTNELSLPDYKNPGGGIQNKVDRVSDWQLAYTFHDFNAPNFARATRGKVTNVVAGTVTDEPHAAVKGSYVPLKYLASAITSVDPVGAGSAYVAGTDYILDRGMIYIPAGSAIPNATGGTANIEVTYAHGAIGHVEGAVTAAQFYEMQFFGSNEARSGKKVRLVAHKVSGGVIQQLGLLGDEYGGGEVTGSITSDAAKRTSADNSAYFYWQEEA
ncbi:hypothetical protein [Xanthomonas sp. XNM01]|uniref:phage tail tube protein n=1 Tax=Xanthomonas sp. XNM01 TaxID=2769289 RepID=UPI001782D496|nr:hypothetical protein [Xanthomonas sp. XNM01]MBD9368858.1 hypothetical protein [Xanthomonas sp. XNM01]